MASRSCTGRSWAPGLILQAFFPCPHSACSFQGCCSMGTIPCRRVSAWKQQLPSRLAGRRPVPPALQQRRGRLGGEVSGGGLPSPALHIFSPPEAPGRSDTHWHRIREKGLVWGSALLLKCCPWRFSSCSRLLAHQLFNSLQPCGLQP